MDLTSQCNQTYLLSLINQQHFAYVHVAPPCGTASRARDRPIPEHLRKAGAPCPRPLRNQDHPRGIPDLRPDEQARVCSANAIYDFCVHLAHACNKSSVVLLLRTLEILGSGLLQSIMQSLFLTLTRGPNYRLFLSSIVCTGRTVTSGLHGYARLTYFVL
jgi:hypothetical protein